MHLVRDGRMLRHTMKKETLTDEELRSELRTQGIDEVILEGDARISVVRKDSQPPARPRHHQV